MTELRIPGAAISGARGTVAPIKRQLIQLTGQNLEVGATRGKPRELADPAPPFINEDQSLAIYGTGGYFLEFSSWASLLTGGESRRRPISLYDQSGRVMDGEMANWDILRRTWREERTGKSFDLLYAGSMAPTEGRDAARWPEDNWTRRIYAFSLKDERWTRHAEPLFGGIPSTQCWLGHCYGHHFIESDDGEVWLFYEKVTEEKRLEDGELIPYRTELFARRMATAFQADSQEIKVMGLGATPYPATQRFHHRTARPNGFLVEGGRPAKISLGNESFYMLSFSSGDFPTDRYGINVALSKSLTGPYAPLLDEAGTDLLDLGKDLRSALNLSWGPGRASFFMDPWGEWWALFHAVEKRLLPDRRYDNWPNEPLRHFHRSLFLAPVILERNGKGLPVPRLVRET